jgi:hypothetical protein
VSSQFPVACSILVACLATAAPLVPATTLSACLGVGDAAVAVSASLRPAAVRLQAGDECTVVAGPSPARR